MGKYNLGTSSNDASYHQLIQQQHQHVQLNAHAILAMAQQTPNHLNLSQSQLIALQQQQQQQQQHQKSAFFQQHHFQQQFTQQQQHSLFNLSKNLVPKPNGGSVSSPSSQSSVNSVQCSSLSPSPQSPTTGTSAVPASLPGSELKHEDENAGDQDHEANNEANAAGDHSSSNPTGDGSQEAGDDPNSDFNKVTNIRSGWSCPQN